MTDTSLQQEISRRASYAVTEARDRFGLDLDFSVDSIGRLEELLDKLYEGRAFTRLWRRLLMRQQDDEGLRAVALIFGAYVGEVIRRRHGGEWSLESVMGNPQILTLTVKGTKLFPPSKILKRLINGNEDDVWFYFQVITAELEGPK